MIKINIYGKDHIVGMEAGRKETKTQSAIRAYRFKKLSGLTYKDVAQKAGCSERMVKQVNTLYKLMKEYGSNEKGFNPEEVLDVLMNGMVCKPSVFPWLTEPKSNIGALVKAFQEYLGRITVTDDYDTTEYEKILDESTGEYVLRKIEGKLVKRKNRDMIPIEEHKRELEKRDKKIAELEAKIAELEAKINQLMNQIENQGE
jgi:seryl-tRNA synthetase